MELVIAMTAAVIVDFILFLQLLEFRNEHFPLKARPELWRE